MFRRVKTDENLAQAQEFFVEYAAPPGIAHL
jgi:hypothetical protein